jgi:hypothetical protein
MSVSFIDLIIRHAQRILTSQFYPDISDKY